MSFIAHRDISERKVVNNFLPRRITLIGDIEVSKPANSLLGLDLGNGWVVTKKIKPAIMGTGGNFSVGYIAENTEEGIIGYLKALDFSEVFHKKDWPRELELALKVYNLERDILEKCKTKKLKKVVHAIADGQIIVSGFAPPYNNVHYLIFELADGDIRKIISQLPPGKIDLFWSIKSIHNTAIGLKQLHAIGVTHQDLKPSNVLTFNKDQTFKVADLGCAADRELGAMYKAGDMGYAPPEAFYGFQAYDDFHSRVAADMYLLGSLIYFHFLGIGISQVLWTKVQAIEPNYSRSSFENDLPIFKRAFVSTLIELEKKLDSLNLKSKTDILSLARELTEVDPRERGLPCLKNSKDFQSLSLERYISRISLLLKKAEFDQL